MSQIRSHISVYCLVPCSTIEAPMAWNMAHGHIQIPQRIGLSASVI